MCVLFPCVWVCLPHNSGSSPLTLPNRINCPLLLYAILFCSGFRSNDRITITRDSYFRWGIFACQPACLPPFLSQFVIISFFFLLPFCFLPNTQSFIISLFSGWRKSLKWRAENKCFPVSVFIGVLRMSSPPLWTKNMSKTCPNSLPAFNTTEIQQDCFHVWVINTAPVTRQCQGSVFKFHHEAPNFANIIITVYWSRLDKRGWESWTIINTVSRNK